MIKNAIESYIRLALTLYGYEKLSKVGKLAGIDIGPNGSCNASTAEHLDRFLFNLKEVCGPVAALSAKTQIEMDLLMNKA